MTNPLYDQLRAVAEPGKPYLHIVILRPREGISIQQLEEALKEFKPLETLTEGIISAGIVPNFDSRKGWTHLEVVVFKDVEAFITWHAHPTHKAFGTMVYDFAEWVVADTNLTEANPVKFNNL